MQYKKTPSSEFVSAMERFELSNPPARVIWSDCVTLTQTLKSRKSDDEREQGREGGGKEGWII